MNADRLKYKETTDIVLRSFYGIVHRKASEFYFLCDFLCLELYLPKAIKRAVNTCKLSKDRPNYYNKKISVMICVNRRQNS